MAVKTRINYPIGRWLVNLLISGTIAANWIYRAVSCSKTRHKYCPFLLLIGSSRRPTYFPKSILNYLRPITNELLNKWLQKALLLLAAVIFWFRDIPMQNNYGKKLNFISIFVLRNCKQLFWCKHLPLQSASSEKCNKPSPLRWYQLCRLCLVCWSHSMQDTTVHYTRWLHNRYKPDSWTWSEPIVAVLSPRLNLYLEYSWGSTFYTFRLMATLLRTWSLGDPWRSYSPAIE